MKGFHVNEPCWPLTQLPKPSQRNLHWIPQAKSRPAPTDCTAEKVKIHRCACEFFTLHYFTRIKKHYNPHQPTLVFYVLHFCLTLIKRLFPKRHWANADPYWVARPQRFQDVRPLSAMLCWTQDSLFLVLSLWVSFLNASDRKVTMGLSVFDGFSGAVTFEKFLFSLLNVW